jgi:hypothetical protein
MTVYKLCPCRTARQFIEQHGRASALAAGRRGGGGGAALLDLSFCSLSGATI